ncbi:alginate export family protein [Methylocystis parvus]|uniref:Outer membrane beta-barrel protein n=1 Tax=Methylocystis parvus TaxID=134 RepID=A0A6B8M8R2_9HYPH|nr:alginate export family protein [Methylocystis parvus]QGM98272.1 outer membrane beta-barrel protein [Methylocystis parvus]WBK01404.1 alginate export family protein [Methylocystis parvus OBBP]
MTLRSNKDWMGSVALGALLVAGAVSPVFAQSAEKNAASVAAKPDAAKAGKDAKAGKGAAATSADGKGAASKPEEKKSYYVPTRGYRLEPQPDIPPYVRNLGKTYKEFEGIDWLNIGLDSRIRFENRNNDLRPWTDTTTNPPTSNRRYFPSSVWLNRTRVYLGVQNILDPFRAVVEFQDSRAINSLYQLQGQEINETDLISAYGELYFKDAFGKDPKGNDRPLTLRAGRFHFELLDRRLIAENEFRNTTNNFEGFRVKIGKKDNDWDIDSFVMRPVNRLPYQFDRPDWQTWIYGGVLSVRRWSEYATIQPYFLGRHQYADFTNPSNALKVPRETNAPGVRIYGVLGNFDYDFDINKQFGYTGEFATIGTNTTAYMKTVQLDAIAYGIEGGYTFSDHPWKPRISAVYTYGSGNKSPFDSVSQNFDIFYGFNQPFSRFDYEAWNNLKAPKVRLEFTPAKNLQIDTAFGAYWLASAPGPWDRANLSAPLGNHGTFVGTDIDLRIRYKLSQFVNLTASYAHFWPGSFTSSFAPPAALQPYFPQTFPGQTGTTNYLSSKPTDFIYLEVTANAFGDGQPITKDPASQLWSAIGPEAKDWKAPSWQDVYVGLNGGGAWSSPTTQVSPYPIGTVPASLPIALGATPPGGGVRSSLAGFTGGLQAGLNYKIHDRVVLGVETDLRGVSGNTDGASLSSWVPSGGNVFVTAGQFNTTLNYLGTLRGRLGFLATPKLQIYGTGGFAYGGVTTNTAYLTQRAAGTNITNVTATYDDVLAGWSAGGGVEWAFMPNWSAKAEYLRYDIGAAHANSYVFQQNGFYAYGVNTRTPFSGNLVQAGVNRHFDLFASD